MVLIHPKRKKNNKLYRLYDSQHDVCIFLLRGTQHIVCIKYNLLNYIHYQGYKELYSFFATGYS